MEKAEETALAKVDGDLSVLNVEHTRYDIKNMIYVVRNQQVMIDSDLAMLYQVETGALNRAVKRNIKRFPEDFRFQLTIEEYSNLKCQSGISSLNENGYGGRRTLPYASTEQGISMLASVLHSEVAVNVSIGIMRAFVEMRRFISNNALRIKKFKKVVDKSFQRCYYNQVASREERQLKRYRHNKSQNAKLSENKI